MKRIFTIITIITAFIILRPSTVWAGNCKNPNQIFYIERPQDKVPTGIRYYGNEHTQNMYNIKDAAGNYYPTFCIDAGRKAPAKNGSTYVCEEEFDINSTDDMNKKGYYAAMIKAYELGMDRGFGGNKIIMQLVFRFINYEYNQYQTPSAAGLGSIQQAYINWKSSFIGYTQDGISGLQTARDLATEAISLGNEVKAGKSYEDLIKENKIWSDKWQAKASELNDSSTGSTKVYRVFVSPDFSTDGVDLYYEDFTFKANNKTVNVTKSEYLGMKKSEPGSPLAATYDVYIDTAGWDGKNIDLEMTSSVYSPLSGLANMIKIMPTSGNNKTSTQNMLIVTFGNKLIYIDSNGKNKTHSGGSSTKVIFDNSCVEENGKMYYIETKDGRETSRREITDIDEMNKYGCPIKCKIYNNEYICEDGKRCSDNPAVKDGSKTAEQEYKEECAPEPTPPNKCDDLDKNSEEYIRDCTDACDPSISLPARCQEFNQKDTLTGTVDDINQEKKEIKACVVNGTGEDPNFEKKDAAGNTYQMTDQDTIANNPYCKISCKENYDFKLPVAQYTESGGYFTLSTDITGNRDCYSSEINENKFNDDLEAQRKAVIDKYNEYEYYKEALAAETKVEESSCNGSSNSGPNEDGTEWSCSAGSAKGKIITKDWIYRKYNYDGTYVDLPGHYRDGEAASCGTCEKNSSNCSGKEGEDPNDEYRNKRDQALQDLNNAIAKLNDILKQYNDCTTGWENNMKFTPTTEFEYQEEYQNISGFEKPFQEVSRDETTDDTYCSGDTNNRYECQSGQSKNPVNTTINKFTCDQNGCGTATYTVSTAKWVQKSKTIKGTFMPPQQFLTYNPYGTIVLDKDDNTYKLFTKLPLGALPVALSTKTGVYDYKFLFSNMGQFNDNDVLGRLIGITNSVFQKTKGNQAGYVCQYIINCDDCDYECDGDNCTFDDCDGDDCTYECDDCIFDGNESTLDFRPFSLNNVFSNEYREISPNWKTDKGKATKKYIEDQGETIYDNPEYSYQISKAQQNKIREFNNLAGSYANVTMPNTNADALINVPLKSNRSNKSYNNIAFESAFLNFNKSDQGKYFTELYRNTDWTLWEDSSACDNKSCVVSMGSGTGPSWK